MSAIFTEDFKAQSYWWDQSPLITSPSITTANDAGMATPTAGAPDTADVVIIGAGYTGLHAAIQTAKAGLSTVVFDTEAAGYGCSTRNGGQISTSIKYNYNALKHKYGEQTATDILAMGKASLEYVGNFITTENIDCDYQVCGRFHGAHNSKAYDKLAEELQQPNPVYNNEAYLVPRSEQRIELGTEAYHGGMVFPQFASVDPGRYHRGCLAVAQRSGASIVSHCKVVAYRKQVDQFVVQTSLGTTVAKQIIVATNGYTTNLNPWHLRRVIPIGSYIIATEEVERAVMDKLMPTNRMLTDSRKLVYYYRPSPDRKRILFGGRVSLSETDAHKSAHKLRHELIRLFPELNEIKVSHSWSGTVAYTFDSLMHSGTEQGVHFAMGYCGSGVGMAGFLGKCVGQSVAGTGCSDIALSRPNFPTRPLYRGTPWFLAPSVWLYRIRDKINW